MSSADLLDILSIGNQPKLVIKHLTKLFDSIAKLNLITHENNEMSALGMYAKDGEYVIFDEPSECIGPVIPSTKNKIISIIYSKVKFIFIGRSLVE